MTGDPEPNENTAPHLSTGHRLSSSSAALIGGSDLIFFSSRIRRSPQHELSATSFRFISPLPARSVRERARANANLILLGVLVRKSAHGDGGGNLIGEISARRSYVANVGSRNNVGM